MIVRHCMPDLVLMRSLFTPAPATAARGWHRASDVGRASLDTLRGKCNHPQPNLQPNVQSVMIDHEQVTVDDQVNTARWKNFCKFIDAM